MDPRALLWVALGGALGAMLRFATASLAHEPAWPWPTLLVNLAGSLLVGFVLAKAPADPVRLFLVVGVLGALTTLSAYSAQTVALLQAGRSAAAAGNVLANALGGPLMAYAGWLLGRLG